MKLQHALAGLENLGPVSTEVRPFVEPWETRIFGIHTVMMAESTHLGEALPDYPVDSIGSKFASEWTWASLRTGAEDMNPFEYFKFRYYEKWLGGISKFFVDQGYITADELATRTQAYRTQPDAPLPAASNPALKEQILRYLRDGDSPLRPYAQAPKYAVGDRVTVANPPQVEHTRLPGHVRTKTGMVDEVYPGAYGYFVSTGVDGIGEPMPVYRVGFDTADIWGADKSEPNTKFYADLFEAYLVSA